MFRQVLKQKKKEKKIFMQQKDLYITLCQLKDLMQAIFPVKSLSPQWP